MPDVTGSGSSFGAAIRSALQQASLGRARPSFNRVSAVAQYRQMSRSAAGRRALGLAGVSPADRTARRWLSRSQAPSRRNADAIGRAYQAMQRGGIPDWFKRGEMKITGTVAYGSDVRDRGADGNVPLLIERGNPGRWQAIEDDWSDWDDDELAEEVANDVIEDAIGDAYPWGFPGGAYSVTISG